MNKSVDFRDKRRSRWVRFRESVKDGVKAVAKVTVQAAAVKVAAKTILGG